MKREGNTIFFANDQEFYDFSVVQMDVFKRTENGIMYHDWEFTKAYTDAIGEGKELVIEDPNSQVVKHQCAVFRTVAKPVTVKGPSLHRS